MDVMNLRIFESVARLGGMNKAANELNTVQSNVTAHVRMLEQELGTRLFHRHTRGISLTEAGQRLLPYAVKIAALLNEARRAAKDDGTPKGPLTLGALETTAALRLSPILSSFAAAYPAVDLGLRTGTTAELVEQVLTHKLQGAFVCGPTEHPELEEETIFREDLVILTAPQFRSLSEVIDNGNVRIIVLREGCSYRQILSGVLMRRGVTDIRYLEFGTLESIYSIVSAGMGITLLPKSLIGTIWPRSRVAVHQLPSAESRVCTVFIQRRDAFPSSALAAFLDHARPTAKQLQTMKRRALSSSSVALE